MNMRRLCLCLIAILISGFSFSIPVKSAWACGCTICCGAIGGCSTTCACTSRRQVPVTTEHVTDAMDQHRRWLVDIFFKDNRVGDLGNRDSVPGILAAMQIMTNQLSSVAMKQVMIIGAMLDAKHQLETQRIFQQMTAIAHKDYHPSEGMCDIGTNVRSLAASERKGDVTTVTIANRLASRQLLSGGTLSYDEGPLGDKRSRLKNFIKTYCNPKDNGMGLDYLCKTGGGAPNRQNKDVNYAQTFETPLTLKLDLAEGSETPDIQDVMALSAYLFAHDVAKPVPKMFLKPDNTASGDKIPVAGSNLLMANRAIAAKRSVAQNTIASIAGLKAEGNTESQPFIYAILKEMGGHTNGSGNHSKISRRKAELFCPDGNIDQKNLSKPSFLHGTIRQARQRYA